MVLTMDQMESLANAITKRGKTVRGERRGRWIEIVTRNERGIESIWSIDSDGSVLIDACDFQCEYQLSERYKHWYRGEAARLINVLKYGAGIE